MKSYIKNKISFVIITTVLIGNCITLSACNKEEKPQKVFEAYKNKWQDKDFKAMYDMLSSKSKENISEKDFVERYNKIYSGIEADTIAINEENKDASKKSKEEKVNIPFNITMKTLVGEVKVSGYETIMIKEEINKKKHWTIEWNEKMIFPNMDKEDKVRIQSAQGKRGEIYDRKGRGLAVNGNIISLGIHPSKFNKNKDINIKELAKILDIQPKFIEDKLNANSNPEFFVPIVNISEDEKDKIALATKLEGVIQQKKEGRVYAGGEAFGSLIGNIAPVTAEDLEKLKGKGYSSTSLIGKRGLEQVYEEKLRGENGGIIYISKQKDGKEIEKVEIVKKEPKNGQNIKLSIDFDLQKKIYEELNGDKGASAAVNPKTGEILAMVSAPSFNSNVYTTYITESQKAAWKQSSEAEFTNRFKNVYSPGSTFKLITAAIGLEKGTIKPEEAIDIQGKEWQANSSWGSYKVTRMADPGKAINLKDAFIYSDNIYFAQAALKIGKEDFIKGCNKFGLGEELPINYPIAKSQVANENNIKSEVLLADSGYGQGEILISPLHVALVYSSLVNEGSIMSPTLEFISETNPAKAWKENIVSKDNIKTLLDGLVAVVDNTTGTGHSAKINGVTLAGKTGTAELKKDLADTEAEQNGWFVSMDTENPKVVVAMIIENVKNRGGSHYVVPKVRNIMEYYLTQNK